MKLSISSKSHINFRTKEVASINEAAELACKYSISTGIYKNEKRNIDNFIQTELIGLDIDDGLSIEEAKEVFKEYKHAIMPTRNHQKQKNGVITDRYRVLLQLNEPITKPEDYYETWQTLSEKFPFIDKSAKDPARQFFPSIGIEHVKETGKDVHVKRYVSKKETKSEKNTSSNLKGKPSRETLELIAFGAMAGERNNRFYKAARDLFEQGYDRSEILGLLKEPAGKSDFSEFELNQVIESSLSKDPKYDARTEDAGLNFIKLDDFLNSEEAEIDWAVENLLASGGTSLIAGPPKGGKSTLIRQLAKCLVDEKPFLKRRVSKSRVAYLALEEHRATLKKQYKKLKIKNKQDFLLHVGSINRKAAAENLTQFITSHKIKFLIIDTLLLMSDTDNSNDYTQMQNAMEVIRDVARKTQAHVLAVHHTNKSDREGASKVMGSTAITGGVDTIILFDVYEGERRKISSQQRDGIPFHSKELIYDRKTETYTLGGKLNAGQNYEDF